MHERGGPLSGRLVRVCRLLAQEVHPSVHVAVLDRVILHDPVDDGLRLLRGRGIIQVDEGLAVYLVLQGGKLVPNLGDVEAARSGGSLGSQRMGLCRIHGPLVGYTSTSRSAW